MYTVRAESFGVVRYFKADSLNDAKALVKFLSSAMVKAEVL